MQVKEYDVILLRSANLDEYKFILMFIACLLIETGGGVDNCGGIGVGIIWERRKFRLMNINFLQFHPLRLILGT
jgi:hypothetical protein